MNNRILTIALIIIDIAIIAGIIYVIGSISSTEKGKEYFTENDIVGNNWVSTSDNVRFEVTKNKITLIIDDETVINEGTYVLNKYTGEIVYTVAGNTNEGSLYLRSASDISITLWYNKRQFNLEKEVIYK